ncbi:MAG: SRPBCC family protein [Sphingobium sp.]
MFDQADGLSARETLHLVREFDAPRNLIWLAWTKAEMLIAWLGPEEFPAIHAEQDLRVGGAWSACLKSPETGALLWQRGVYREIDPPARLAFTFKWEGDHEDGPPVDTLVTIALSELPGRRTRMDFMHQGLKSTQSAAGHRHGWTSSFGRLDQWLANGNARLR